MERVGYPAYANSAGWLGYSDDRLRQICRDALAEGWTHLKIEVGADIGDDIRRCTIIREESAHRRRHRRALPESSDIPAVAASRRE